MSIRQNSNDPSPREPAGTRKESVGFYHDGRYVTMREVIENYNSFLSPSLSAQQTIDLVAYLKSL
jgi:hypothetical protein